MKGTRGATFWNEGPEEVVGEGTITMFKILFTSIWIQKVYRNMGKIPEMRRANMGHLAERL